MPFSKEVIVTLGTALNNTSTSGVHDSKHVYVPKATFSTHVVNQSAQTKSN